MDAGIDTNTDANLDIDTDARIDALILRSRPRIAAIVGFALLQAAAMPAAAQDDLAVTVIIGNVARSDGGGALDGVLVEFVDGIGLPTFTLPDGFYLIAGLRGGDGDVVLRYTRSGYMRTLERIPAETAAAGFVRRNTVLKQVGAVQQVDLESGGMAVEESSAVTVEPGDLMDGNSNMMTGMASVELTPIDPSTEEIELFPTFDAVQDGVERVLESFAALDINITVGGRAAQIAPGRTLRVEFPIPDAQQEQFELGQVLADFLWSLNETTGVWEGGLTVTVGASTADPNKKAFFGEIPHLSTWNCDQPLNTTCLKGRVVDALTGAGVANVVVEARGANYNGQSSTVTDSDGDYCIAVKRGAQVKLEGNAFGLDTTSITVASQSTATTCRSGGCQNVDDLVFDPGGNTACISGQIYNKFGLPPIPPAFVLNARTFTTTQTDAGGAFCLNAPPNTDVELTIVDLSPGNEETMQTVTVRTDAGPASCGSANECTTVQVGEPLDIDEVIDSCGACGSGASMSLAGGFGAALFVLHRGARRRPRGRRC